MFVEANVKKWGLAPVQGTLAPPPAYGFEAGSLLLERGRTGETSHLLAGRNSQTTLSTTNHYGSTTINIPNMNELTSHYDQEEDIDDDDNTPLIQQVILNSSIPIPSPQRPREGFPTYSPPAYSTYPRLSLLIGRGNSYQEELERNRRAGLV